MTYKSHDGTAGAGDGTGSDKGKIESTLKQIGSAAELNSARLKKAKEDHEAAAAALLVTLHIDPTSDLGQTLHTSLNTAFIYGQIAGESSETQIIYQEQLDILRKMMQEAEQQRKESAKRDRRTDERDQRTDEREEKRLALFERQVGAIEALVKAADK